MKMRTKRIFSAMLCAVMLTVYGMPVLAAESNCTHSSVHFVEDEGTNLYIGIDVTQHNYVCRLHKYCNICGDSKGYRDVFLYSAPHNFTNYQDLGHRNLVHDYYITCGTCGSQYRVTIGCEGPSHSKPF